MNTPTLRSADTLPCPFADKANWRSDDGQDRIASNGYITEVHTLYAEFMNHPGGFASIFICLVGESCLNTSAQWADAVLRDSCAKKFAPITRLATRQWLGSQQITTKHRAATPFHPMYNMCHSCSEASKRLSPWLHISISLKAYSAVSLPCRVASLRPCFAGAIPRHRTVTSCSSGRRFHQISLLGNWCGHAESNRGCECGALADCRNLLSA